jgi:hypothetical protein
LFITNNYSGSNFWDDTIFLVSELYDRISHSILVHDEVNNYEPPEYKMPFRVPIKDQKHFIGQVYEYDENGIEFPKFTYN